MTHGQPPPVPRARQLCFGSPCTCCPACCRPRGKMAVIPPCECEPTETAEHAKLRAEHGLPPVPGTVIRFRYVAQEDDWWAESDLGWLWLEPRNGIWTPAPLGPPY